MPRRKTVAHLFFQGEIDPLLSQRLVFDTTGHSPAVQPGQRPLAWDDVAYIRACIAQGLDLLGTKVGKNNRNIMAAKQIDRLFQRRVKAQHIAPQRDQSARCRIQFLWRLLKDVFHPYALPR